MKLTQLEYFCVAARYHNITKAAKELFVTQPSISNAIKALEEEFGVNLFFRNNNKLTLTPEGEIFYKSAEELLAHADSVESEFHELRYGRPAFLCRARSSSGRSENSSSHHACR